MVTSLLCGSRTGILGFFWFSACCDGRTRKGKSLCVSIPDSFTALRATPGGLVVTDGIQLFTGYKPKYNSFCSQNFTRSKRPSHADTTGRKRLKKNGEQFTSSTSFSTFQISFTTPWKSQIHRLCKWKNVSRGEPRADALHGPGGYDNDYHEEWHLREAKQSASAKCLKKEHAVISKPWTETLSMRHSIKISTSKSQSENTKDRQEMPSIRP